MENRKLYVALTRKPNIKGVSYIQFVLTLLLMVQGFLITQNFLVVPFAFIVLVVFHELNKRDDQLLDILKTRFSLCPNVQNRKFWGNTNSYETLINKKD
ncbi:type IV secretion system protein VirB3 [Marinicella sp. W31]|uniref:type IV secretion system protein VirB3 n=1 Tax=Marinicella sp. W31 TaxID=3023713 RepID=UPI003756EF6D